jgi:Cu2+-containing amine oxidase
MAYRVGRFTGGSLHDHTFGVKVDFDVVSKENTFQTQKFKWGPTLDALNAGKEAADQYAEKPAYMMWDYMRYTEETNHDVETSANVDPENPGVWLFGDITQTNKWGNPRMYKLMVNDAHAKAGNPAEHVAMPAASFVNNFVTVTQYKESEQGICGDYDMNRLDENQVSLDDRVDGESIAQEDLVAWVSLAAMHLPHAEDWPMTNNLQHGLTISPWNFFDENPSMDMPNYHRMHPDMTSDEDMALRGSSDMPSVDTCVPPEQDTTMEWNGVY